MNLSAKEMSLKNPVRKKVAALYARVSSRQQKKEETIESQMEALLKFSKENGYEVPDELIFCDEDFPGKFLDRPGLDNLRDAALEGYIDVILVYSPDRLARRFALQLILEEEFRKQGVKLIYLTTGSSINTPEEQLLAQFQGIFAEYEHAQILDRTRRGRLHKVRKGDVKMLAKAPYGYYNDRNSLFYTIKENEARIVREIFHLYTNKRCNIRQIVRYLEEKNISSPKGASKWDHTTISGMLKNPAYIGTAYYGKTERYEGNIDRIVRYKTRGRVAKPIKEKRFKSKDLWEPLSVPAIICESDFEVAQELLKKNKELAGRNTKEPSVLQGLLICGLCGGVYYKKRRKGCVHGKNYSHYTCRNRLVKGSNKCTNSGVRQEILDKLVWNNIIELLKNPDLMLEEIDRRCSKDHENIHVEERRNELKKEIKQIEKAHNKLLDAYQEGDCLTLDELRRRSKGLKEKESLLRKEVESFEAYVLRKASYQDLMQTLEMFRKRLDKSYEILPIKDKQNVVRALIEDIVIFPDRIEVKHSIPSFIQNSPLWRVSEHIRIVPVVLASSDSGHYGLCSNALRAS
jgi:site-specific DNA recombinase